MNKLEQLIKETDYTQAEWETHRKVETNCQLQDLKYLLDIMLESGDISQEQYTTACENADTIVEKYNKYDNYDWQINMQDAIQFIITNYKEDI